MNRRSTYIPPTDPHGYIAGTWRLVALIVAVEVVAAVVLLILIGVR